MSLASRVSRVTFFEDRAQIERQLDLDLVVGQQVVTVEGLTPLLDDPSLRVTLGKSEAEILSTQVRRSHTRPKDDGSHQQSEQKRLERQRLRLVQRLLNAHRGVERCKALQARWARGLRRGGEPQTIEQLRAAYQMLHQNSETRLAAFARLQDELDDLDRELQRVRLLASEAARFQPQAEGALELVIGSPEAISTRLDFSYRSPCAVWRPEHQAELISKAGAFRLRLTSVGCLWQTTSEDWRQVEVALSTARPSQAASAPPVQEHSLVLRPKSEEEKRSVVVVAREQTIANVRALSELPGVEDGGEPLAFRPARPVDVPSDGRPVRVEMASTEIDCQLERVAYPEFSKGVHLRVTAVHDGHGAARLPLLAGPVDLRQDGASLGRGRLTFVAPGQAFELGFGLDDALRVQRAVEITRETVPLIGTQKVTFAVTVHVSNLSDEARSLVVKERVPVSELSDIKVIRLGTYALDNDGFSSVPLELPGNAVASMTLSYRVEAGAKVKLPW